MRKIGITLWLVAIILAAGLSAILVRTNLLAGPQARSSDPVSNSNLGKPTSPKDLPATSGPPPVATPTVPTTSPTDTPPTTAAGPDDFYQALQRIAQQVMGTDGRSGFLAWYQQLEAAYGRVMPAEVAFAWYRHLFPDRLHGKQASDADAPACGAGTFSLRTCGAELGTPG
jgi:hypothetical protein